MMFISLRRPSPGSGRWPRGWYAVVVTVLAAVAVGTWTLPTGLPGWGFAIDGQTLPVTGALFVALVGLAGSTNGNDDIGRLVEKIERFQDGDDVDFGSERDDEVGHLYDAVGSLAATARAASHSEAASETYRQELYRITSNTDLDSGETVKRLLELGCERLGVENGLITHIDEEQGRYEIETVAGGEFVEAGAVADLEETFCRETITSADILGIFNAREEGFEEDPGYTVWDINCYIGGKIEVGGDLYGTVCFVDPDPRANDFTHDEKVFVDLVARWVSHELEQREQLADLRLYERALEAAPVGVTMTDPDREDNPLIYANERFSEVTGYPTEAALGRNCRFLQGEGTAAEPVAALRAAIDAAEPVTTELRNYRRDGTEFWNRVSVSPIENEAGEVTNFVGFQEDVTERAERERRIEAIVENTTDPIYIKDCDRVYQFVNQAACDNLGLEPPDVVGSRAEDLFGEASAAEVRRVDEQVMETGEPVTGESTKTLHGEERVFLDSKYPYRDPDGEIIGVVGISKDITERKEREEELKRQASMLDSLFEQIPVSMYVKDREARYVRTSTPYLWDDDSRGEEWFRGKTDLDVYPKGLSEGTYADDLEVIENGEPIIEREEYNPEDDDWILTSKVPWRDDDGEVRGLIGISQSIHEQKERQRELRETKRRLELALEGTDTGIWEWEVESDAITWNDTLERLLGLDPGEFEGSYEAFQRRVHPEDLAHVEAALEQAVENDESYQTEFRLRTADDDWIWVGARGRLVYGEEGTRRMVGVVHDVTERKEYEQQLQEERDRFVTLFENLPNPVYRAVAHGGEPVVQEMNRAFEETFGVETGTVQGDPLYDHVELPAEERERLPELNRKVLENGGLQTEARRTTVDGVRTFQLDIALRDREEGPPEGYTVYTDITERKERRRKLRETNEQLSAVIEASPDALVAVDLEGNVELWNPAATRIFGWEETEAVGEPIPFLPEGRADEFRELRDGIRSGESCTGIETKRKTKDGELIDVSLSAAPLRDSDGEVIGIMGALEDISERKQREAELRETRDRLAEHNQTLRRFAEISADREASFDEKIRRMLELGRERLGTSGAFLSRIDEAANEFEFVHATGTIDGIRPGVVAPYSETYCRKLVDSEEIFEVLDAPAEGWAGDPAFERWGLHRYFGARVFVEGELVGTLSFVDEEAADEPLTDDQRTFIELATLWVSYELERQRRERALREYREYTDDVLDAIDDVFYVLDRDATIQRWNDTVLEVTGYGPDEVQSMHALDFFAEADHEAIGSAIEDVYETGDTRVEASFLTKDGESIPYEFIASRLEDPDGNPVLAGVGRDVTERKERERQLREREHRLERYREFTENVLDAIDDVFYLVDEQWNLERWNESLSEVTGYDDSEISEMTAGDFFDPDDAAKVTRALDDIENRIGEPLEVPIRTSDGESIPFEFVAAPLEDPDGNQVIAGIGRDITERKRYEQSLERTADLLDQTQQLAKVGGWELDLGPESPAATWTEQMYRLHDLPRDADIDIETIIDTYHPDDRERVREVIETSIENGTGYDIEARMTTGPDGLRWVRAIGDPIFEDGEPLKFRGAIQDVTERKERERELERTRDLLSQAQELADVGGWEVDLSTGEPRLFWTDELYRLHGLSPGTEVALEEAIEFFHPDDRQTVREAVDRAIEHGESYDVEGRLQPAGGGQRWVRAIGNPIQEDGEVVRIRGSLQDVTEQKERELALQSLHEAGRGLLGTETETATAELVVETAAAVLDVPYVSVYLLDDETNQLRPAAYTDAFERVSGGAPPVSAHEDAVIWNCFAAGNRTVFGNDDAGRSQIFGGDVDSGLLVPIGEHGVFALATDDGTIADSTRRLAETFVATTEAAFDRLENEAEIRARDAELETQNQQLRRQVQITEIIRGIDQSLVGATSREEIETAVCERLADAEDVSFAWIGSVEPGGDELVPRNWAGESQAYLNSYTFTVSDDATEPAAVTARSGETTVVSNVGKQLHGEPWRREALASDYHSVVSVPLTFEEYSYGVLAVYADEPGVFEDLEGTVFAELGQSIANAITAVKTRTALYADSLVELTLRMDQEDEVLAHLARQANCTVEYEGIASQSTEATRLFFATTGADDDAVQATLADLVAVREFRLVSDEDERSLYEMTVGTTTLASKLVRHGASPRSITATPSGTECLVDVSTTTDVREFVEMLRETYPTVELAARRDVERSMGTRQQLVSSLFEDLTKRQLEVLQTAYLAGYFEWPRGSTGEEIAEMLGVTQPTVNRHLRLGQQRLLAQLFEQDAPAVSVG